MNIVEISLETKNRIYFRFFSDIHITKEFAEVEQGKLGYPKEKYPGKGFEHEDLLYSASAKAGYKYLITWYVEK
mgnify:CR=1 FL=1